MYLVPTPIGNLEDVTLRSLRVLREAGLILAEDTRTTLRLLDRYKITGQLESYTEHSHAVRAPRVVEALATSDVALVSEAGMPGINDPGQGLVAEAVTAGYRVIGLPGASAVPLAVAVAGFPITSFTYLGFLPHRSAERRKLLTANGWSGHTLVGFETPHRVLASLRDLEAVLGDRRLAVCRELSKLHEEVFRGSAATAIEHFSTPKGEFTLVIEGAEPQKWDQADAAGLDIFLRERRASGGSARDTVAAAAARFGVSRRSAYAAWEALKTE